MTAIRRDIHQRSSNKSNLSREFRVLAMDGNSIPFTQFRAFASAEAIDDSNTQRVFRSFSAFSPCRANRRARFITRPPPTRERENERRERERWSERFSRRTGMAIVIFRNSHGPAAVRYACKLIAAIPRG